MNDTRPRPEGKTAAVSVYLLDGHEVVRRGLRDLLAGEPDIDVIGEAGTVASALAVPALGPKVAVLGVRPPDGDGGRCAGRSIPLSPGPLA